METMDIDVPLDLRMLDAPLEIMPLSDYNQLRADHGMTKLDLQPGKSHPLRQQVPDSLRS